MMDWLPPLIRLQDYGNQWDPYLDALYARFAADFLGQRPPFMGKRMGLKRYPMAAEKEATFWHFISEGPVEDDRLPDLRRCECIAWPRAIMDHVDDAAVRVWREERKGGTNIHLWCEEVAYLVVVADRGDHVLPWTAYPVEREHQQRKLNQRWEQFR